jgi:CRISPR system Cascade subunit CasB
MNEERESDERTTTFITKLGTLETGERARLKRDAGKAIAEAQNIGLFYRLLYGIYGISLPQEESYFLIATLYPFAENSANEGNFGATLHKIRNTIRTAKKGIKEPTKSLDRRMEVLLDADMAQLSFRLRQMLKLAKSTDKGICINWQKMLEDLLKWNWTSRIVQKEWARAYFAPPYRKADFQNNEK